MGKLASKSDSNKIIFSLIFYWFLVFVCIIYTINGDDKNLNVKVGVIHYIYRFSYNLNQRPGLKTTHCG